MIDEDLPPRLDLVVKQWKPGPRSVIAMPTMKDRDVHGCDPDSWLHRTLACALTGVVGVIVVVDQEVAEIDIDPLVRAAWALPTTVVSAYVVSSPGMVPEAWYDSVSPYAWAVTYRTLLRIVDVVQGPLPKTFGFELLIGEIAKMLPDVTTLHHDLSIAYLTVDPEISEARGNLYYREIADVEVVHGALGWTSPSS